MSNIFCRFTSADGVCTSDQTTLDFGPDESGLRNFVPLDLERNDYNHCLFCFLIALLCSRLVLP